MSPGGQPANQQFLTYISSKENLPYQDMYIKILSKRLDLMRERNIPFYIQDCRDYHALINIFKEHNPDTIVHLACRGPHANRLQHRMPYSSSATTASGTLGDRRPRPGPDYHAKHFIYLSSSMIYGTFPGGFVDEESARANRWASTGLSSSAGRSSSSPTTRCSACPTPSFALRLCTANAASAGGWGRSSSRTPSGDRASRSTATANDRLDFTYIDDFVQGVVRVIGLEASKNQIFNITYGQSQSLNDLLEIVKRQFPDITVEYMPKDKLMPDRGTLSIQRARDLLGYDPQWPIEKGFAKYIGWYLQFIKDNPGCYGTLEIGA